LFRRRETGLRSATGLPLSEGSWVKSIAARTSWQRGDGELCSLLKPERADRRGYRTTD